MKKKTIIHVFITFMYVVSCTALMAFIDSKIDLHNAHIWLIGVVTGTGLMSIITAKY